MIAIPLDPNTPFFSLECDLDQEQYKLTFYWSERTDSWSMSLATADGQEIFSGQKLVVGYPIGWRFQHAKKPSGSFVLVDTAGFGDEAKLGELETRFVLTYG